MPGISYQLYCSRNYGIEESLAMLSQVGFDAVEGYGPLYDDLPATKAMLAKYNLTMPTGHFSVDLAENTERTLEICRELGIKAVIVPYIMPDQRPVDSAGWAAFGARLAKAAEPLVAAGLKFGWHNHEFEFDVLSDGKLPLDLILEASPLVGLELDLGWTKIAGHEPAQWIAKYADRLVAVHVKDIAPDGENADEDGWADVGHGIVDWAPIKAALDAAGVDRYVVEHDKPSDHQRFASRSLASVKAF